MKTNSVIFLPALMALAGLPFTSCTQNSPAPLTAEADQYITVTVRPHDGSDSLTETQYLRETVHVTELLRYPDDDAVTVPFHFTDTASYARLTEENLNRRITILVDSAVVSAPVVRMPIADGACSFTLPPDSARILFPGADLSPLFPSR